MLQPWPPSCPSAWDSLPQTERDRPAQAGDVPEGERGSPATNLLLGADLQSSSKPASCLVELVHAERSSQPSPQAAQCCPVRHWVVHGIALVW